MSVPNPIKENVRRDIKATLALVTEENGYAIDLIVEGRKQRGTTPRDRLAVVSQGADLPDDAPMGHEANILRFDVAFFAIISKDDERDIDEVTNLYEAEIRRAMTANEATWRRNDLVVDTVWAGTEPFDGETPGGQFNGATVSFDITMRTLQGDGFTQ